MATSTPWASRMLATFALMFTAVASAAEAQKPPPLAVEPFNADEAKAHQEVWAEQIDQPIEVTNSIGMELRLIPPGEFMMGSPETEQGRRDSEGPRHRVQITNPFYLGSYEVTQAEYEHVMDRNPSRFRRIRGQDTSRFPVEMVSWADAVEFCHRLSKLREERSAGRVYRLPTEAEWEYACRAGTSTPFHFGSAMDSRDANCLDYAACSASQTSLPLQRTTTVGSYHPNGFGLYDMHGNVGEWCADWSGGYGANALREDPQGPQTGCYRVIRGGGWPNIPLQCRSAFRGATRPVTRRNFLGFRVVLVPAE